MEMELKYVGQTWAGKINSIKQALSRPASRERAGEKGDAG